MTDTKLNISFNPSFFVVNFAHKNLNLQNDDANIRVIGAFRKKETAVAFSKKYTQREGLDCYLVCKGSDMIVPCNYDFQTNPEKAVKKLETITKHHEEQLQKEKDEFEKHLAKSRSLCEKYKKQPDKEVIDNDLLELEDICKEEEKENTTEAAAAEGSVRNEMLDQQIEAMDQDYKLEDAKYAKENFMKMLEVRKKNQESVKNILSKEGVGDTKKVPEDLKGSFNFVTMSFMEDVSPEKEHAFTIHSVHDTEKNARDHVDEKISKQVTNKNIYVICMYEWIQINIAFCSLLTDKIDCKYRDPQQNDIMQYHLRTKEKRNESIRQYHRDNDIELKETDIFPEDYKGGVQTEGVDEDGGGKDEDGEGKDEDGGGKDVNAGEDENEGDDVNEGEDENED